MDNGLIPYASFIKDIKNLIYRRQYEALKKVNAELMQLYWEIGGEIESKQQEQGWGKSVVEVLAKELQKEFPGVQGFSTRNLWLMRRFYIEYSQKTFLQPLGAEIKLAQIPSLLLDVGWKKNVVIMEKCKDPIEREFYIKMTRRFGWTKDVLINNIENKAFERYLTNQTNFENTVPEKYRLQAKLAVKDDYNFDFLEMGTECSTYMTLYKYRSDSKYTEAIIKNQAVWFSKPNDLNDPLECSVQTIATDKIRNAIVKEEREYYEPHNKAVQNEKRVASRQASEEIVTFIRTYGGFSKGLYTKSNLIDKSKYELSFVPNIKYMLAEHIIMNAGIFCLSESSDNVLMWSHYGGSGKGIAIGFYVSQTEDYNNFVDNCMLLKVDYSNHDVVLEKIVNTTIGIVGAPNTKTIHFQVPEFTDPFMKSVFSSKNSDWKYEQEWRFVSEFSGERKLNVRISEIVFGPKCPIETKVKYIDLAKKHLTYPVAFYEININGRTYNKAKCEIAQH